MSVGGGCEAAVTARTRCVWVAFWYCSELLYGRRFPLRLEETVYRSYVRPAILYGSEPIFHEGKFAGNFTKDRTIHGESNVWSTAQK